MHGEIYVDGRQASLKFARNDVLNFPLELAVRRTEMLLEH